MQKVVHRAEDRGKAEHGWLHSRFSFSFADWYNGERMGFGALRVINDDIVDPASGFPMHPHRDMEIITIVTKGAVTHEDSMGNRGTVRAGEVQVMSAGTGVVHSEFNASATDTLELYQIWIFPDRSGHPPRYDQKKINVAQNGFTSVVGPMDSDAPLTIQQAAHIVLGEFPKGESAPYLIREEGNGLYVLVLSGSATIAGEDLAAKDAIGIWEVGAVPITANEGVRLLCIEVPLK